MTTSFETLHYIGFDDSMIKTYLAVLELGSSSASDIADKAEMKRPTTYDNLDKLKKLGFVIVKQGPTGARFSSVDPRKLQVLMERRTEALKQTIPTLSALFQVHEGFRPTVQFYDGIEGIRHIATIAITENQEKHLRILQSTDILSERLEDFHEFLNAITKKRISLGITQQNLRSYIAPAEAQNFPEFLQDEHKHALRTIKYLPKHIPILSTIYMWDNKIGIISTKHENYALLIESEDYTTTMKSIFDLAWLGIS